MMNSFKCLYESKEVFSFLHPYIIAEIGVNHENSMDMAKLMIDQVAAVGGHAVKFQTYKAELLASPNYAPSYWDRSEEPCGSQFELFKKYDKFSISEYEVLADYAKCAGVDFLSTPFDLDSVNYLAPLMKFFKVASADITNIPLLREIARQNKPVLLSTGASTFAEIEVASKILRDYGAPDVGLMHCVLNYPTSKENAQLSIMRDLIRVFGKDCSIGYSDHVKPNLDGSMPALEVAVLHGALVIEKHYTYDRSLSGNDHYHAMDKLCLGKFIEKLQDYRNLYGHGARKIELEEQAIANARRKIITTKDIQKGETLTEKNLIALRANHGINISLWDEVIGKTAIKNLIKGEPIFWGDFS